MRYVSDLIGDQYLEWEKDPTKPVLISSPTGSGKTSFVLKKLLPHAISQNKCIVYLSNRKMLHEQFSSEVEEELHRLLSVDGELSENQKAYIIPLTYQHCEMCGSFPPPMDPSETIDKWIKVPRYKPPIVEDDSYYKIPVWGMIPSTCDPSTLGSLDTNPLDILHIPKKQKVFLDTDKILYYVFDEAHYFLSDSIFNTSCNFWFDRLDKIFNGQKYFHSPVSIFMTATPESFLAFAAAHISGHTISPASILDQYIEHLRSDNDPKMYLYLDSSSIEKKNATWADVPPFYPQFPIADNNSYVYVGYNPYVNPYAYTLAPVYLFPTHPFPFASRYDQINFEFLTRSLWLLMYQNECARYALQDPSESLEKSSPKRYHDIFSTEKTKLLDFDPSSLFHQYRTDYDPYANIDTTYFRDLSDLLPLLSDTSTANADNKWIIFLNNIKEGESLLRALTAKNIDAVLLSADHLRSGRSLAVKQFESITKSNRFTCSVLITTSVMDCGVSIKDPSVKNVIISHYNKTIFLQMLGRKRVTDNERFRLYIRLWESKTIYPIYRSLYDELLYATHFRSLDYKKSVRVREWTPYNDPNEDLFILSHPLRRSIVRGMSDHMDMFYYPAHDELIRYKNPSEKSAFLSSKELLAGWTIGKSTFIDLIYDHGEYFDALSDFDNSKDPYFYLKRQLKWIGKEYSEQNWYGFSDAIQELTQYISQPDAAWYVKKDPTLYPEKQDATDFRKECLRLLRQLPCMPQHLRENDHLYKNGTLPGLKILNTIFSELNLPYTIVSKQTMTSDRKKITVWRVEPL